MRIFLMGQFCSPSRQTTKEKEKEKMKRKKATKNKGAANRAQRPGQCLALDAIERLGPARRGLLHTACCGARRRSHRQVSVRGPAHPRDPLLPLLFFFLLTPSFSFRRPRYRRWLGRLLPPPATGGAGATLPPRPPRSAPPPGPPSPPTSL
jgi:hypothetical protein